MRRDRLVHFRYLHYLSLLCKGTLLSTLALDFIILKTFMLYSEFSAYLNGQIHYWFLTMKSQRNISFYVVIMFIFSSHHRKKKKMSWCQSAAGFVRTSILHRKVKSLHIYKNLSSSLREGVFNKNYMVNIQGGMPSPIF